ncbi:nucleotidyltransferase family protein [Kiloniella majae]|uniref:nucleotidyltransferase family protein n=1 Tax=Kiloniella majae TaxID=1938558 RepID=UPI001C3FA936|nr:nucleotidyltransferase family protein [Kiloniella majae]
MPNSTLTARTQANSTHLINFLQSSEQLMGCLKVVRDLELPDCWVAAGLIRNSYWDHLQNIQSSPIKSDIDVVYFDPQDTRQKTEHAYEKKLRLQAPEIETIFGNWSVKNQARMHQVNRDRPYQDCYDALQHWPETVTAIAARLTPEGEIELLHPFGLDDLYQQKVRPCPYFKEHKLFEFKIRQDKKRWQDRWPDLITKF